MQSARQLHWLFAAGYALPVSCSVESLLLEADSQSAQSAPLAHLDSQTFRQASSQVAQVAQSVMYFAADDKQ